MPLSFRVTPERASYVAGESVVANVVLENDGTEPVTVPHPLRNVHATPTYTVFGPDNPRGDTWTLWERGRDGKGLPPLELMIPLVLPPRGVFRGELALGKHGRIARPGRYRVEARFEWAGMRAVAPPVTLDVEPLEQPLLAVGTGIGAGEAFEVFASILHRGRDGPVVLRAIFARTPPGEPPGGLLTFDRAAEPATARAPLAADSAFMRRYAVFDWAAWQEDGFVAALAPSRTEPLRLALDAGETVLGTPLLLPGHELDLFLASGSGLALARFHDPARAGSRTPEVLWRLSLERAPGPGGTACATDGSRHVAWISGDRLHHAGATGGPPAGVTMWALDPDLVPVPGGGPVVAASPGAVNVGLVVRSTARPERCFLLDARVPEAGKEAERPAALSACELPCPATGALIAYRFLPGAGAARAWLLLGEDGALYAPDGRGVPVRERANLADLALVVVSEGPALVEVDPLRGPTLRPIGGHSP